jgi:hypothetical protein
MNAVAVQSLLAARAARPFAWGVRDCALLAFDAVHALTGRDPVADIRGQWHGARSALRMLQQQGGWAAVCAARIGPEVPADNLHDGDVVLRADGVCSREMADLGALAFRWCGQIIAQGDSSLVTVPPASVVRAWRPA